MYEEAIGFIAGNARRRQIIEILEASKKATLAELSKKTHSPAKIISTMMDEMETKGLVKHEGGAYVLTELGDEVAKKIKGV
jgi:predicted transcriptional regulator